METGAHALVAALRALDVEVVFGLPGVHNLAAWEALDGSGIRLVGVRHEQTAVYAADGLARTTGRLGVALTTTGPGAANALGATGEAWASGSPVLVIATDIPTTLRRPDTYRGVLHECRDQGAMFAPVVKRVVRVSRAEEIGSAASEAARLALEAPTAPVYLEIPTDLLSAPVDDAAGLAGRPGSSSTHALDASALDRAATLCAAAERPLVWAGGGALRAGARDAVQRLAGALGAPVVETNSSRGLVDPGHAAWIGLPPHLPEVGALWDEADLVVAIGSDLDGMTTQNWAQPQPPRLVAINVDEADARKSYRADEVLVADAAAGAAALADAVGLAGQPKGEPPGAPGVAALDASGQAGTLRPRLDDLRATAWARLADQEPGGFAFLQSMRKALAGDPIVFADMCIPGYWLAAMHPFAYPRQLAYPIGWGTLGFAFPASIGGALGQDRPVLCLCGDGGIMYALGELALVRQERVPLTILVVDDGGYGMLRFDQRRVGAQPFGVDLFTPDWRALAQSFELPIDEVDGLGDELADAVAAHLTRPEPSIVVARAELTPPPTTSPRWYRHGR